MSHGFQRFIVSMFVLSVSGMALAEPHRAGGPAVLDSNPVNTPIAPFTGGDPNHHNPAEMPLTAREYVSMQLKRSIQDATDFGNSPGAAAVPAVVGSCTCFWDNGGFDDWNGQGSAQGAAFTARCADDFFLPECGIYRLDSMAAVMLVDSAGPPSAFLELYADCNGRPSEDPFGVFEMTTAVQIGEFIGGLEIWEFTFDTSECNLRGGCIYWASPVGIGDGSFEDVYYFATTTAPNGGVQLNQGHFTKPQGFVQYHDWTPVEVTNVKKRDFAFAVCTTMCDILCDNGQADLTRSLHKNVSANLPHFRAADNFALAPCTDWYIDMIEVCVLTSCECASIHLEVYGTDPITMLPTGDPLFSASDPKVFDLGYSTVDNTGVTVNAKRLQFGANLDLGQVLEGGKTYWVSIVEGGTLSGTDRLYFCYAFKCEKPADCQIKITEAAFYKPVFAEWRPYSDFVSNGEDPNELAFTVCGRPAIVDVGADVPNLNPHPIYHGGPALRLDGPMSGTDAGQP